MKPRAFDHISYEGGTGKRSKEVETYNFHKAAAVLAEYGFDCIRLANDWQGADFLAHHKPTDEILRVQLKTCLVIDKKYEHDKGLYTCFPLDKTGCWYLIKHSTLIELVREYAQNLLTRKSWLEQGSCFTYRGNEEIRTALEEYSYKACHDDLGFRECTQQSRKKSAMSTPPSGPEVSI